MKRAPPLLCAAAHVVAAIAMVTVLRPGTEAEPDVALRAAYVAAHPLRWKLGWATWILAAASLLAFYAWWAKRAKRRGRARLAFVAAALGAGFDVTGQALYVGWLPEQIEWAQPLGTVLTAGFANGLYTVGGVILTLATPLVGAPKAVAWTLWIAGLGMTLSVTLGSVAGMMATTAAVVVLLPLLCVLLSRRLP